MENILSNPESHKQYKNKIKEISPLLKDRLTYTMRYLYNYREYSIEVRKKAIQKVKYKCLEEWSSISKYKVEVDEASYDENDLEYNLSIENWKVCFNKNNEKFEEIIDENDERMNEIYIKSLDDQKKCYDGIRYLVDEKFKKCMFEMYSRYSKNMNSEIEYSYNKVSEYEKKFVNG